MMILVESNIIVLGLARMNVGSWQVKFNNEMIYYRLLSYIDSAKPKMVIFLLGNS